MPNHVTNELIFRDLSAEAEATLLEKIMNAEKRIDFSILLPKPLNAWDGNEGVKHQERFKILGMDWARENWGTKWNAYEVREPDRFDGGLRIVFDTAWSPPYGWLLAVFNGLKMSFEHNWFDEGQSHAHHAVFNYAALDGPWGVEPWTEEVSSNEIYRRLHVLKYGVDRFEDEEV